MAVSKEVIQKIIDNADIVDIISQYIPLEKKGNDYKGVCPFHNDTNPSLSVSPSKKVFKCFSCGASGNAVGFVERFRNISFLEALKEVGKTVGIEVELDYHNDEYNKRQKLHDVLNKAVDFYSFYLQNTENGSLALDYLKNRHIDENIIKRFKIGLSPKDTNLLYQTLEKNNILAIDMLETGLINGDGQYIDVFRNRIMFPVTNPEGKTVGFSGRIFDVEKSSKNPKYINTSETRLFQKNRIIYNFYEALNDIKLNDQIYIMEGFMDVIAAYRAGVMNTVATMGTALTEQHLKIIGKVTKNVVLCFDGDDPGIEASKKAIRTLIANQFNVRVVVLPIGVDPDEYINQHGKDALFKTLKNPSSSLDYLYDLEKRKLVIDDLTTVETFKKAIFSHLGFLNSRTISALFIQKMANDLSIPADALMADLHDYESQNDSLPTNIPGYGYESDRVVPPNDSVVTAEVSKAIRKVIRAEEELIRIAYYNKNHCLMIDSVLSNRFANLGNHTLLFKIMSYYHKHDVMDEQVFASELDDNDKRILAQINRLNKYPDYTRDEILKLTDCIIKDFPLIQESERIKSHVNNLNDKEVEDYAKNKRGIIKLKIRNNKE